MRLVDSFGMRVIVLRHRDFVRTRWRKTITRMPIIARAATIFSVGVAVLLSACAFHLVGHTPLPQSLHVTYVETQDNQTDFAQGLRKALLTAGAQMTDDSSKASAVVHVLQDSVTPRVLAVSPTNLPREYEITYTVRFSVSSGGKDLLPPQQVSLSRDYSFDEHVLLAKDNEEAILRGALARDLVDVVMRRLRNL